MLNHTSGLQLIFAVVPPAEYYNGYPCFIASLIMIGATTYMIGNFARLFGCAVGLEDAMTAISFVALGTSLPDTFASRQAAQEAPDADAAIGNVTGATFVASVDPVSFWLTLTPRERADLALPMYNRRRLPAQLP